MNASQEIRRLLEKPYWPQTLEAGKLYERFEDDSPTGRISVVFGGDGDGYIMLNAVQDPNEHKLSMRFRMPMMGGGQSPRVRNALLILAEAIRLDNKYQPQDRE